MGRTCSLNGRDYFFFKSTSTHTRTSQEDLKVSKRILFECSYENKCLCKILDKYTDSWHLSYGREKLQKSSGMRLKSSSRFPSHELKAIGSYSMSLRREKKRRDEKKWAYESCCPWSHGGCGLKSFKLVWWCHQLLSAFIAKCHLPRVSRQSRRSLMIRVIMK